MCSTTCASCHAAFIPRCYRRTDSARRSPRWRYGRRFPSTSVLDLGAERFEEPVEVTVYYVASEALTNTAKHAQASRAEVRATRRDGWLELTVSDDGQGGVDASRGSGLTGLVDRVEAIGGTIHIDGRQDLGTAIHVKLPIRSIRG